MQAPASSLHDAAAADPGVVDSRLLGRDTSRKNSGKLKLKEWHTLRRKLQEIEELIPHIDLIIRLKEQREFIEKAKTNQ